MEAPEPDELEGLSDAYFAAAYNTVERDSQFEVSKHPTKDEMLSFSATYMLSLVTLMNTCSKSRYIVTSFMLSGDPDKEDRDKVDSVLRRMLIMLKQIEPDVEKGEVQENISEELAQCSDCTFDLGTDDERLREIAERDAKFCTSILNSGDHDAIVDGMLHALN